MRAFVGAFVLGGAALFISGCSQGIHQPSTITVTVTTTDAATTPGASDTQPAGTELPGRPTTAAGSKADETSVQKKAALKHPVKKTSKSKPNIERGNEGTKPKDYVGSLDPKDKKAAREYIKRQEQAARELAKRDDVIEGPANEKVRPQYNCETDGGEWINGHCVY